MKNYSYIGISFIILVFGIWSVPKIVDKFTNKELSYILDANKDLKKIPDFLFLVLKVFSSRYRRISCYAMATE